MMFGLLGLCVSANAATKCVALNETMVVSESQTSTNGMLWTATFDNGLTVRGLAAKVPSDSEGSFLDTAADVLTGCTDRVKRNCWCKMIEPYESFWIFLGGGSNGKCSAECVYPLGYPLGTNERMDAYRRLLFMPAAGNVPTYDSAPGECDVDL